MMWAESRKKPELYPQTAAAFAAASHLLPAEAYREFLAEAERAKGATANGNHPACPPPPETA